MNQRERECPDKAIYPTPARKRNLKRVACYALLGAAAAFITVPGVANAELDNKGVFFKLNNPGDPNFNQLLGISDNKIIAGYFGDGTVVVNNGYVLVPNTHYSVENFAGTPRQPEPSRRQ
ncbi:MAG TPA: hypothetical protein VGP28_13085 [Methylocella sp.]|jgi:hypothetical protein|nr:hypothetical protein [Methylocella sp.]